jgi:hypothetical protein
MAKAKKSDMNPLGLEPFQGCAVTAVGVTVSNAGGGLHDPLEVDPELIESIANIQIGDSVYLLIRADCNGVSYKPVKGDEDKIRYVPSFHATDTTIIDDEWAVEKINAQRDKIQRLRDEAEGKQPLFDEHGNAISPLMLVGAADKPGQAQAE